jgi:hypothetical protein
MAGLLSSSCFQTTAAMAALQRVVGGRSDDCFPATSIDSLRRTASIARLHQQKADALEHGYHLLAAVQGCPQLRAAFQQAGVPAHTTLLSSCAQYLRDDANFHRRAAQHEPKVRRVYPESVDLDAPSSYVVESGSCLPALESQVAGRQGGAGYPAAPTGDDALMLASAVSNRAEDAHELPQATHAHNVDAASLSRQQAADLGDDRQRHAAAELARRCGRSRPHGSAFDCDTESTDDDTGDSDAAGVRPHAHTGEGVVRAQHRLGAAWGAPAAPTEEAATTFLGEHDEAAVETLLPASMPDTSAIDEREASAALQCRAAAGSTNLDSAAPAAGVESVLSASAASDLRGSPAQGRRVMQQRRPCVTSLLCESTSPSEKSQRWPDLDQAELAVAPPEGQMLASPEAAAATSAAARTDGSGDSDDAAERPPAPKRMRTDADHGRYRPTRCHTQTPFAVPMGSRNHGVAGFGVADLSGSSASMLEDAAAEVPRDEGRRRSAAALAATSGRGAASSAYDDNGRIRGWGGAETDVSEPQVTDHRLAGAGSSGGAATGRTILAQGAATQLCRLAPEFGVGRAGPAEGHGRRLLPAAAATLSVVARGTVAATGGAPRTHVVSGQSALIHPRRPAYIPAAQRRRR